MSEIAAPLLDNPPVYPDPAPRATAVQYAKKLMPEALLRVTAQQ